MLVKSFASNTMFALSYNLNNYIQCIHVWKLFLKHTVIALRRLDRNQKLIEIFAYPSNNYAFYGPDLKI